MLPRTLILCCTAVLLLAFIPHQVKGQEDDEDEIPIPTTIAPPFALYTLKGVTIQNSPFAEVNKTTGQIEGLVVDLIDAIIGQIPLANRFNYSLYLSPDGMYGNSFHGRVTGMIGEVVHRRADFAVADLTVTEARSKLVDFTTPFINTHLAALVRKADIPQGVRTIGDLVKWNSDKIDTERHISYGSLSSGATTFKLSQATDDVGAAIFRWLSANPSAMVRSMKVGLEKVKAGKYAFITESTFAEHLAGQDCTLASLADASGTGIGLYERYFAVALPKGSPHLAAFNRAIEALKENGTIDQLKRKYWKNNCLQEEEERQKKKIILEKVEGETLNSTAL